MSTTVTRRPFGAAPDGTPVERWTIESPGGPGASEIAVLTYGGILHACRVPDRDGVLGDVVLALPSVDAYAADEAYLGALVGRYANRIAHARFSLDGTEFRLPANEGTTTLHGGPDGFHRRVWAAAGFDDADRAGVVLRLRSPDGDMGFPGDLDVEVTYSLDRNGVLGIAYRATTDRPTVVNLTQHAYWNLAAGGPVDGHELAVDADAYLPVDAAAIPLGAPAPTAGTPFALGGKLVDALRDTHPGIAAARGVDHCFVLRGGRTTRPRPVARLADPGSGRVMETWTTEPGIQVYTANHLGPPHGPHTAVCLETQHFPDAPNRPEYPSTVLRPGEVFRSATEYRFGTAAR
ncbi:galactose mutarotase [Yinghuangia sp. ASG 101]|uniref:aldose epimerase family protein n=1 Tax=Yinghuangia sp. ASG 101 TaxID=2896848 RepID=UPI001E539E9E|nr:aldose epimerase family protein [Yinghuangia sp. ASG 101]UGQ10851.1 galactose mutarotase [Yinghuangia sp. ASG 101]